MITLIFLLVLRSTSPASAQACDCVTDGGIVPGWLGDPAGVRPGEPLWVELPDLDATPFLDRAEHPFPETTSSYWIGVVVQVDGARIEHRAARHGERGALVELTPLVPLRPGSEIRIEIGYARPDLDAAMRAAIEAVRRDPSRIAGALADTPSEDRPPAERPPIPVRTASLGPFVVLDPAPDGPAAQGEIAARTIVGDDACRARTLVIEGLAPGSVHTISDRDRPWDESARVARVDDRGTLTLTSREACGDPPLPTRAALQALGPRGPAGPTADLTLGSPTAERPSVAARVELPIAERDAGPGVAIRAAPEPAPAPEGPGIPWIGIAIAAVLALGIAAIVARRRG